MKNKYILLIVGVLLVLISSLFIIPFNNGSEEQESIKGYEVVGDFISNLIGGNTTMGYEFLDGGNVVHIWNERDDYYFDKDSGIQLTNHYEDYWTKNIFCLGYYSGGSWNKIKCADELENFNRNIKSDELTYVNATLWKDFTYEGYNLRFGVQYHLKTDDKKLSVKIYLKNLGEDIPFNLGFVWKIKDIEIPSGLNDDFVKINRTNYQLNENLDLTFKDMKRSYNITIYSNETDPQEETRTEFYPSFKIQSRDSYLSLDWNENLNYKVKLYSDGNQENAYLSLLINAGLFSAGQEKSTTLYWIDAPVVDAHGIALDTDNAGQTQKNGMQINATSRSTLLKITKDSGIDAPTAYLLNSTNGVISNASFVGDDAIFNDVLEEGLLYWVVVWNSGVGYLDRYHNSGSDLYPIADTNINWTGSTLGVNYQSSIVSITTDVVFIPDISIVFPENETYNFDVTTLNYTCDGDYAWYSFDDGATNSSPQVAGLNWTGITTSFGSNTLNVFCNDSANNIGNDSVTFGVNISITTALTTPIDYYNSSIYNVSISFNSTPSNVNLTNVTAYIWNSTDDEIYVNTTDLVGTSMITTGHNITNLPDGNYTWNAITRGTSNLFDWDTNRTFIINTIPNITFESPTNIDGANLSTNSFIINTTITERYFENITFDLYNSTSDSYNSTTFTDGTRFINYAGLPDGTYYYNVTTWTITNQTNSTETREIIIDTTEAIIIISSPINGTIINEGYATSQYANITINWSSTDDHLGNCWVYNLSANVSVTCGDNFSMMYPYNTYINESYLFYLYANDTFGNIQTATLTATWVYDIINKSMIFNTSAFETALEPFTINTTYDNYRWNDFTINLIYNGTRYTTTTSGTSIDLSSTKTINIPTLIPEGSEEQNLSFKWQFILTNNSGTTYYNSSLINQLIKPLNLSLSPMDIPVLNFTTWNEENLTREYDYDFYGTFIYWLGDGSSYKNLSISNTNINETLIYINENLTYYTNAHIQYEKRTPTYVKRSYFLRNASLTETLQHIKLFLLLDASSTSFIIEVIDESRFPVEDAYVYIQRYYPSTGAFETTEIAQTDETGTTIGHFEEETEDYRIIITLDGVVVYEGTQQRMICKETPCTLTLQIGDITASQWQNFGNLSNLVHSLNFAPSTNIWTYSYIDTSGSTTYGRLGVYSLSGDKRTDICNESSTSAAATLTCNVTGNTGTIYAGSYISRSPEILLELKSAIVEGLKSIFGLEGLFLSMIILMILGFAGLWNPAIGIILEIVGVIFLNLLGIASFGATAIWGIIFIGLILLWGLKT